MSSRLCEGGLAINLAVTRKMVNEKCLLIQRFSGSDDCGVRIQRPWDCGAVEAENHEQQDAPFDKSLMTVILTRLASDFEARSGSKNNPFHWGKRRRAVLWITL